MRSVEDPLLSCTMQPTLSLASLNFALYAADLLEPLRIDELLNAIERAVDVRTMQAFHFVV